MDVRQFAVDIGEARVHLDLVIGVSQVYLFIGDGSRRLNNLHLFLQTDLQPEPLKREVLEEAPPTDELRTLTESIGLALARRTKGPVFYSYNLPNIDKAELLQIMGGVKKVVFEQLNLTL